MPYLKENNEDFSSETMVIKRRGNKIMSSEICNELSTQNSKYSNSNFQE